MIDLGGLIRTPKIGRAAKSCDTDEVQPREFADARWILVVLQPGVVAPLTQHSRNRLPALSHTGQAFLAAGVFEEQVIGI